MRVQTNLIKNNASIIGKFPAKISLILCVGVSVCECVWVKYKNSTGQSMRAHSIFWDVLWRKHFLEVPKKLDVISYLVDSFWSKVWEIHSWCSYYTQFSHFHKGVPPPRYSLKNQSNEK